MLLVSTTSLAVHMSLILCFQDSQSDSNVFIPQLDGWYVLLQLMMSVHERGGMLGSIFRSD
jgi:hypothetical protein